MTTIRQERPADIVAREALLDEAFGETRTAKTSERLREDRLPAEGLAFIAADGRRVIGTARLWHVACGAGQPALLLGPVAVAADCRGRGIGAALVRRAVAEARKRGHGAVMLVGDAPYYGRFGFSAAKTGALWLPGPFERHRLLALELAPGALDGARGPHRRPAAAPHRAARHRGLQPSSQPARISLDAYAARTSARRRLPFVRRGGYHRLKSLEDIEMADWPVHARIDGPIVMIGFGSIGKGTLPLIERHFTYDKSRFVVIDPEDKDRKLLDERGIRFVHEAVTKDNYRQLLTPLLTAGGGQGFCVNLSVDTSSVDDHGAVQRARRALHRHRERALGRLLFRHQARAGGALELRAARKDPGRQARAQARQHHRGVLLRRQSRHGVVVRQAGAGQRRQRHRPQVQGAEDAGGLGPARQEGRRQGHPHRRARHPARQAAEADGRVRQHLVGGRLHLGRHAAGRARLGHAREVDAGERPQAQDRLPGGDLSAAAGRQHPRALLDADAAGAIRLPGHPQRVDLDRRLLHPARRAARCCYRPTCHYAYHPCNDAVLSLHEMFGQAGVQQEEQHILDEHEIIDGIDELGVLLYGHKKNAYWYGSQLSIEETREIAPYQNATGLQVTSAVLAGMVWALENPKAGIVEADEMDYRRCLEVQMPYLGPVIGAYTDWTPLTDRPGLFPEDIDKRDPWQFKNVLVR